MRLPKPDQDARTASDALCRLISDNIGQHNGWISFARYMEQALYTPSLGYYAGGAVKLGREGDFTTSPEITPLFGAALAQPIKALLEQSSPHIIEFGAGTGKLAFDLLTELSHLGVTIVRYTIIELSGELRARQQAMLKTFPQIEWIDALPDAFSGVIIGNEVLDAMPVHIVKKSGDTWREVGVAFEAEHFIHREQNCSTSLLEQVFIQIPNANALPEAYTTEVHPQAMGFMHSLSAMLAKGSAGAAILIDYGFPAREYYLNQRHRGTLMCHYRHRSHDDPFFYPGLQDITAHVDFTSMAQAAESCGLDVLAYMNQASFLLASGIGELLLRTSPEDAFHYLPQANAVQKLLSPSEMGELFKVLVVGKNVELPDPLARADRSDRL